jgi:MFS family permease
MFKVDSKILGAFIFTLPLAILFFARALDGLTGGDVSIANAYLADITSEKDRNRNFGKMSIATNLGFVVGPAFAGILSITEYGVLAPVLGAIVISLIGMVLLVFYIPESRQCSIDSTGVESQRKFPGYEVKECITVEEEKEKPAFREIFKLPNIPYMLGLNFLIDLSYNIFYTSFPLHAIAVLGWDLTQLSLYYTILCAFIVIVQGPVLSRASKKYPDSNLIIFGSLMLGTNYLLLIPGNFYLTYLATVFFALGDGLMWPSFLSLLSKVAGRKHQGTVQGFASSSGSLASIIGLLLGGLLYEILDGSVFFIAGLVIYIAFILNFRLRRFEKAVSY